ncbi:hypothetical protein AMTR_s00043p00203720 [Amborella trichopoda]|uniref:Uncharacterized protein n=1 Tax=Amborella trichopoda TaxID=13333 RepID=W1PXQ1_AMBTC|nr:hypothetical protein AMTR_s00043p00203720 [Amborella trichopoda]
MASTVVKTGDDSRAEGLRDDSYAEGPREMLNSPNKLSAIDSTSVLHTEAPPSEMGCVEMCPGFSLRHPSCVASDLVDGKSKSVLCVGLQSIAAKMYPLFHRSAARKARFAPRPVFDPCQLTL